MVIPPGPRLAKDRADLRYTKHRHSGAVSTRYTSSSRINTVEYLYEQVKVILVERGTLYYYILSPSNKIANLIPSCPPLQEITIFMALTATLGHSNVSLSSMPPQSVNGPCTKPVYCQIIFDQSYCPVSHLFHALGLLMRIIAMSCSLLANNTSSNNNK